MGRDKIPPNFRHKNSGTAKDPAMCFRDFLNKDGLQNAMLISGTPKAAAKKRADASHLWYNATCSDTVDNTIEQVNLENMGVAV